MRHVPKHTKTEEEVDRECMERKIESLTARATMAQAEVTNLQNVMSELKVATSFVK